MEECRPSFGGERRLDIVSGKGVVNFNGNHQMYTMQIPNRPSQVASSSSSSSSPWGFSDPEMKRRKRIAKYKVYTIEGRFKASFKNGFRWIKNKCSDFIHGY